jgi:hypothetical protein
VVTTTTTSTTRPAATAVTKRLTETDDGTSISVAKGSTIIVVLSSTYWTYSTATNPSVLTRVAGPTTSPAHMGSCVPGAGCGTVSVTYRAVGVGHAQITASRTTCGEALACSGKAGAYAVQMMVTG